MYSWSCSPHSMSSCSTGGGADEQFMAGAAGSAYDGDQSPIDGGPSVCPICDDLAYNRHFGAKCCNACAAFFRRTITNRKAYVCSRGKNCVVNACNPRHMCKFCRFQRCIWNGMSIATALSRIPGEKRESMSARPPIKQLVAHQHAAFLNRYLAAVEVQGGRAERVHMGRAAPAFADTVNAARAEFAVVGEYLRAARFDELGFGDQQLPQLVRNSFYPWLCFTTITSTARNTGFKTAEVYFVDESHLRVEEAAVLEYFSGSRLRDPAQCARMALGLFQNIVNVAQKFHSARLDEDEVAAMFQLLAFKQAQRLQPDSEEAIRRQTDQLFSSLRSHYEGNFDDVALRLGTLILFMDDVQSLTSQFNELIVIMTLNGYTTVLERMTNGNTWTYG